MNLINICSFMQHLENSSQIRKNTDTSAMHAHAIHIRASNIGCARDNKQIFSNLNFEIKSGEALFVRGPNGAGKSTLLMALAGLLPFEGTLDFGRSKQKTEELPNAHLIHFVSLLNAMKPQMTLAENLDFWCRMFGGATRPIPAALEKSGLGGLDNFQAGHLSTGQRHRLSLARLLVNPRPVWLLDEPSSALDDAGDAWVARLIEGHLANNGLVIAATHRPIHLNDKFAQNTLSIGSVQK
ncbi:MAG: heme ABC exporter ATP-binding protein CcmA [Devosiaceae bacterium]|nr:heme ABC exporter ATP-binding protein CcmA [Devosiaceae bacterium]